MARDLTHFIVTELGRHGFDVEGTYSPRPWLKAQCVSPDHDDRTPSLSINRHTGSFRCFGCGIKGSGWNDLRKYLDVSMLDVHDDRLPDPFRRMRERHEVGIRRANASHTIPWDTEPWKGRWGRVAASTLRAVDARRWYDDGHRCYRILLPIRQYGELLGWTARRLDDDDFPKGERGKRPWLHSFGIAAKDILYPLDAVIGMESRVVVLVEGPGDALRLVNYDIPGLSILGTPNWDASNVVHLMNAGAERIIIATDNDESGEGARRRIEPDLLPYFDVEHFHCPDRPGGRGGHDPRSMPVKYLKRLWRLTREAA